MTLTQKALQEHMQLVIVAIGNAQNAIVTTKLTPNQITSDVIAEGVSDPVTGSPILGLYTELTPQAVKPPPVYHRPAKTVKSVAQSPAAPVVKTKK